MDSRNLIFILFLFLISCDDLSCRFKWTENAIAILDNRSTQHYAIADFYPGRGLGHERVMDRIAIEGDRPL